jgi:transposase-like protein
MSSYDSRDRPEPAAVVAEPPTNCPSCRSRDLKTTSKVINAETYWRCASCGEVWNVARLRAGSRYTGNPFRR